MRSKEEIEEKLKSLREHLKTISPYLLATMSTSRQLYLEEKGMVDILEWILEED